MYDANSIGLFRTATILRYNNDGSIRVGLDEGQLYGSSGEFNVPIPAAWTGPNGEFIGGYPGRGSSVVVSQGFGGQWYIVSYINSNNIFDQSFISTDQTRMAALKPGRALIQSQNENYLFADPILGIQAGNAISFLHANPVRNIISHNFNEEFSFTHASRKLSQIIKRDLIENATRNILNSTLDSQGYEDSLFKIGLDPTTSVNIKSRGEFVRNPPLTETRELFYEFDRSFEYTTDQEESSLYSDSSLKPIKPAINKNNMRSDVLSLSLEHPNHLIETIKGTVVDSVGNILDINRNVIPIGRTDSLSLRKNVDKSKAHDNIRSSLRKSIAYHFELNARKGKDPITPPLPPPNTNDKSNYSRDRSRFFIDIDKEGQIKINIPSSSEVGNVPLLTRYENYSTLLSKEDSSVHPNSFIRAEVKQDIFLESFSGNANVTLSPGDNLADYGQAIDRFNEEPIKLGTAFHDITKTISEFQESAGFRQVGIDLVSFDEIHPLNQTDEPLSKIVSNEIIVSGPNANAGGRSGTINLDGFININIGANTIDRQSLWLDTAGSVISRVGRDKQGISYAASLDGDMLIQIGGAGIGNSFDSRFANENDAYRNGKLDLRVLVNGQLLIIRADETGLHFVSPGRMTFWAQQDIVLKSNSNIKLESELIVMYAESSKRIINRFPANSIG